MVGKGGVLLAQYRVNLVELNVRMGNKNGGLAKPVVKSKLKSNSRLTEPPVKSKLKSNRLANPLVKSVINKKD
jgi:hypothetical protein